MQDSLMKFDIRQTTPNCAVVKCEGNLSWEDRDALAERIAEYLNGHAEVNGVVLDLGDIGFVNSAGLGALFQLAQALRSRETALVFANVSPVLQRLFRTVGLHHFARVGEELSGAVASFGSASAG